MLTCPHCGKPAMSHWRKSYLGPARSIACRSCGKPVSVHWSTMLVVIAVVPAFVFALDRFQSPVVAMSTLLVTLPLGLLFHEFCVPVVPKKR